MAKLHFDFETRSAIDLTKVGTYEYAIHPTTEVLCFAFAFDDEPVEVVSLMSDHSYQSQIERVGDHVKGGGLVFGHNVVFEIYIWNFVLRSRLNAVGANWPTLSHTQCRCTMAMAYAMALPGSLEKAAAAVGIQQQKDMKGHRLMLAMCKPKDVSESGEITWRESDEDMANLMSYCAQDVEVERELEKRLLPLAEREQQLWQLDFEINQRGVPIDVASAKKAKVEADRITEQYNKRMSFLTNGLVEKTTYVSKIIDFLKFHDVDATSIGKSELDKLLEQEDLPDICRQVLELRKAAAKSSTAKLEKMIAAGGESGRVRGVHQFHGASTGRWAGRLLQTQNLPRPTISQKQIEDVIGNDFDEMFIDLFHDGDSLGVISSCLRGLIAAPKGSAFLCADFSAIEARCNAWLAGESKVLEVFAGHGKIYEAAASGIYRKPIDAITKEERQIGKVAVLALGYGGGVGAFKSMAKVYGVHVDDEIAEAIKIAWRDDNQSIVSFWFELENAAHLAVLNPGKIYTAGFRNNIKFIKDGSFLYCMLPSERVICYAYPEIKDKETPWGDMRPALFYKGVDSKTYKWTDLDTYGGKLCENVVQATCRDLLSEAMLRLNKNGYEIVMHVHDEILVEQNFEDLPDSQHTFFCKRFLSLMSLLPNWAAGFPMALDGWTGTRYRK